MGAERMFDRAAKAATKAAEAVQTAAAEASKTAAATPTPVKKPSKPAGPALSKAKAPKQLEKAKSYKQTKPQLSPSGVLVTQEVRCSNVVEYRSTKILWYVSRCGN